MKGRGKGAAEKMQRAVVGGSKTYEEIGGRNT